MKRVFLTIIFWGIVFCFYSVVAARDFPGFRVLEKSANSIVFEWTSPDLDWQMVRANAQDYVIPQLLSSPLQQNEGQPILPIIANLFEFSGKNERIVILDSVVTTTSTNRICPGPAYRQDPKSQDILKQYDEDPEIYQTFRYFPDRFLHREYGKARDLSYLRLAISPIQYNPVAGSIRHLRYLKAEILVDAQAGIGKTQSAGSILDQGLEKMARASLGYGHSVSSVPGVSTPSPQKWYNATAPYVKLYLVDEGIYSISGNELMERNVNISSILPETIQLFHNGVEGACQVVGMEDGTFDSGDRILFYAERLSGEDDYYFAYTDTNVYWLTWGGEDGLRYNSVASGSISGPETDTFPFTFHLEKDLDYYHGDSDLEIHETEQVPGEGWVWEKFILPGTRVRKPFDLVGLTEVQDSVQIRIKLKGTTLASPSPDHHARILVNETVLHDDYFNDRDEIILTCAAPVGILKEEGNFLDIQSVNDLGAERSQFYFDWVEFDYIRKMKATDGWIKVHTEKNQEPGSVFVNGFSSDSIVVWNSWTRNQISTDNISKRWNAEIKVQSAGLNDGNYALFEINGQRNFSGQRGINLVVLDPETGEIQDKKSFDTYASREQAENLAGYVHSLAEGTIVLAAIRDEGSAQLSDTVYTAIETLGSMNIRQVGTRDSWALLGKKGAEKGTVPEVYRPSSSGPAHLTEKLTFSSGGDSWGISFAELQTGEAEYIVFDLASCKSPGRIVLDKSSTLYSQDNGADYLVVTHSDYYEQARRLAEYRESRNGFRTRVVLIEDIYDEFNYGITDPLAIKSFAQYAYENWQNPAPAYLLLFGDASWDPKFNLSNSVNMDFVPSIGNPVSDLLLVCFDGEDDILPEMSVGRLPAQSQDQAEAMVDKIVTYENTPSSIWKKKFLFVNGGFNQYEQAAFQQQSKVLATEFVAPPPMSGSVAMLNKTGTELQEGENRQEILDILNNGIVWANFIGHAGSRTWDLMFNNSDILELQNEPKYPFISSMTCHTGRFAEPDQTSFGENFLVVAEKGAIAFWGTSGWGYSHEDYLFLRRLFPIAVQDTVHTLGDAITLAKVALWEAYGLNPHVRDLVLQYNLLGDPALKLALPEKPDLAFLPTDISIEPVVPSEADSVAEVHLQTRNLGLATTDSVQVTLYANHEQKGRVAIEPEITLAPLELLDSVAVTWSLSGWTGSVELEAILDPNDLVDELDEQNNRQTLDVQVLSSRVQLNFPLDQAVVSGSSVQLHVLNPQSMQINDLLFEFQIDTAITFDSPFLQSSGPVNADILRTTWQPAAMSVGGLYFWRCRLYGDQSNAGWTQGSFYISGSGEQGWQQSHQSQFEKNVNSNTEVKNHSVQLFKTLKNIYIESAGFNDGNFARIFINNKPVINTGRGHNVVVINNITGQIDTVQSFDTYRETADADNMAHLINQLPDGFLVLIAIKDEGSGSMTENAYLALESIGSARCREAGPRDSWAILGRKGASTGSVPESYAASTTGTATLKDSLSYYSLNGTVTSTKIGPAIAWGDLSFEKEIPSLADLSLQVIGQNKSTGRPDTLKQIINPDGNISLNKVNASLYPYIHLVADLSTQDGHITPLLKQWQVTFEPASDLSVGHQVFSQSADTLLVGQDLDLSFRLFNLGQSGVDSVIIKFEESDHEHGRKEFAKQMIPTSIAPDSFIVVRQQWVSSGKSGLAYIYVEVDPEKSIEELNESNNSLTTSVYVLSDTLDPRVEVTFDGQEIVYGDLVSVRPTILARIFDNSPKPIEDTTAVNVFLDGNRLSFFGNEGILKIVPANETETKAVVEITPVLKDGDHALEFIVSDPSGNQIYHRSDFQVNSEFQLLNVMNYPNPFQNETDFTFVLTQPGDVSVDVYTLSGRHIKKLETDMMNAGFNRIYWNGLDEDGDELANGVYIYRVKAKNGSETAEETSKVILMR